MDTRRWSLSTSGQCDFVIDPPKKKKEKCPKEECLEIDKLIKEERQNQAWNIKFQKALVKRLEASERRMSLSNSLINDDFEPARKPISCCGDQKKKGKSVCITTSRPDCMAEPTVTCPKTEEKSCVCLEKIKKEECKRKKFIEIMEKEQCKFEKKKQKAQERFEKCCEDAKKKCEECQRAVERGYFKRNKNEVEPDKAEETFSVFIHMDPGDCNCRGRPALKNKIKNCIFKTFFWIYIAGFIVFGIVYGVVNM